MVRVRISVSCPVGATGDVGSPKDRSLFLMKISSLAVSALTSASVSASISSMRRGVFMIHHVRIHEAALIPIEVLVRVIFCHGGSDVQASWKQLTVAA